MFSHLCRACLSYIDGASDAVPLFKLHKNLFYYRLCNKLGLSLSENDQLATNLCKNCALEILKSYKFRLMYMESDRKLREMRDRSAADFKKAPHKLENLVDTKINIGETKRTAQTNLKAADAKWKCNECNTGFESRSQLRTHRFLHRLKNASDPSDPKPNKNGQKSKRKSFKCTHCAAEFRTTQLKAKHEQERHINLNEPSVLIEIQDDDYEYEYDPGSDNELSELPFANFTEVNVDDNSPGNELTTDLGLYLIEKHNQISSFDPLGGDNASVTPSGRLDWLGNNSIVENNDLIKEKWKCNKCLQCFRTRNLLSEHKQLHVGAKEGLKTVKKEVKTERVKVTNVSEDGTPIDPTLRWKCQTCSSAFGTRELLRIHRRNHFSIKESTESKETLFSSRITYDVDEAREPKKKKKIEM